MRRRKIPNFHRWLTLQTLRFDEIGFIARFVKGDSCMPNSYRHEGAERGNRMIRHLVSKHGGNQLELQKAVDRAINEYREKWMNE